MPRPRSKAQAQAEANQEANEQILSSEPVGKKSRLARAREACSKILKKPESQWRVVLDTDQLQQPLPHIPTGSLITDYLIGGEPNKYGVRPCPGLPRGRVTQVWGHESAGKCLPADSYITTPAGIFTVAEIFQASGLEPLCVTRTTESKTLLLNREGRPEATTHMTHNGRKPLYCIRTFSGAEIRSTGNHPHLVLDESGFWCWKQARYLQPGDVLVSLRHAEFGSLEVAPDEAYATGLLIADGHFGENRISVTNDDPDIKTFIQDVLPGIIGVDPRAYDTENPTGSMQYHFNSKVACASFYERFGVLPVNSPDKMLGKTVRSFGVDSLREFLRGYFDCECSVDVPRACIEVSSASHELLVQIKLLLTRFGIVALLREKHVKGYPENQYWRLVVSGDEARRFIQSVGTRSQARKADYDSLLEAPHGGGSTNHDSIPFCGGLLRSLYQMGIRTREVNHLCADYMGSHPRACLTRDRLRLILNEIGGDDLISQRFREILDADYYYDAVESITDADPEPTFDFAMETTASFIANGFVTHNTTLALTAAAQCIRDGGIVLYVDWENDIVPDYAAALGIPIEDADRFELVQPETLEDGIKIATVYATAGVDMIIFDSVGAATPARIANRELVDVAEQSKVGELQQVWSQELANLKRIIAKSKTAILGISQIRAKISQGPGYGPATQPQGGNAWKFYSSVRMELKRIKSEGTKLYNPITHKTDERVSGGVILCKMIKCKLSKSQGREEVFYIAWGEGIDDVRSVMEIGAAHGIIKKAGSWLTWLLPDGESVRLQGTNKMREYLKENPEKVKILYQQVLPFLGSSTYAEEDFEEAPLEGIAELVGKELESEMEEGPDYSEEDI